jgi:nucleotide-binding universal stress UspA family protein
MYVLLGLGPGDMGPQALEETVARAEEAGDDLSIAVFGDSEERDDLETLAREHLADTSLDADLRHIEADNPGGRLVDLAESGGYDHLVIPGGHRSPLGKIQFDDVTEFVLLNATVSVTLVR